jgi:hypothetical protein
MQAVNYEKLAGCGWMVFVLGIGIGWILGYWAYALIYKV